MGRLAMGRLKTFKQFLIEAKHIGAPSFDDHWMVYLQGPNTDYIGDVIVRAQRGRNNEQDVVRLAFGKFGDEGDWTLERSFGRTVQNYIEDEIGTDFPWSEEETNDLKQEVMEAELQPGEAILRDIFS
jgi:hypothetical protein